MRKEDLIATLEANRRLGTPEQVIIFDRAVQDLARESTLSPNDLTGLFRIFDDATGNEEIMFGLVHLVEDAALDDFLAGFLESLGELEARAPGWAKLFHYRILNSERAREAYSTLALSASEAARTAGSRILRAIISEEGAPLRERAAYVLAAAGL
jgi:hypothetical protein